MGGNLLFIRSMVTNYLSGSFIGILFAPFGNVASSLVAVLFDPLSVVRKLALTICFEVLLLLEFAFFRLGILTACGSSGSSCHIEDYNTLTA